MSESMPKLGANSAPVKKVSRRRAKELFAKMNSYLERRLAKLK